MKQLLAGAAALAILCATAAPAEATTATSVVSAPTNVPTISTSPYVTGYVLGGIQTVVVGAQGILANANVSFNSGTFTGSVDEYIFTAAPTGGGTTDHAAFALTATDTAKLIGVFHLSDCTSLGGILAQCQQLYQSQIYASANGQAALFIVAVVRGTPTFTASTDATFTWGAIQ